MGIKLIVSIGLMIVLSSLVVADIDFGLSNDNKPRVIMKQTPITFNNNTFGANTTSTASWTRTGTDVHLTNIGDNVGIGTASPEEKLDVVGDAFKLADNRGAIQTKVAQIVMPHYDTTEDDVFILSGTSGVTTSNLLWGGGIIGFEGATSHYFYASPDSTSLGNLFYHIDGPKLENVFNSAGTTLDFRVESDNKEYMFYINGSTDRVGIGTSAPTHELNVVGDVNVTGVLNATDICTWDGTCLSTGSASDGSINSSAWNSTSFSIYPRGNISKFVGIGTATPTHELNVVGDVNITGNLTTTNFKTLNGMLWDVNDDGSNLAMNFPDVGGNNYVSLETTGGFFQLYANPNPANDYLLATITETQGADTEMNFYEGGTTHNRFWSSGSVRIGGGASRLCTNLTSAVDCDTPSTGADLVVEDDIWSGGSVLVEDKIGVGISNPTRKLSINSSEASTMISVQNFNESSSSVGEAGPYFVRPRTAGFIFENNNSAYIFELRGNDASNPNFEDGFTVFNPEYNKVPLGFSEPTNYGSLYTAFFVANDADVGIGNTNPTTKLHLANPYNWAGMVILGPSQPVFIMQTNSGTLTRLKMGPDSSTQQVNIWTVDSSDQPIVFKLGGGTYATATDEVFRIRREVAGTGPDWIDFYDDDDGIMFGAGDDASISWDGTNLIFNTNRTTQTAGTGNAWFSKNVSATGYITRTSIFDKNKTANDYIKDASYYVDAKTGKINHTKFYGYSPYEVKDPNNCWNEIIGQEYCYNVFDETTNETVFECAENPIEEQILVETRDVTRQECGTKLEEGVMLDKEIDVLRQRVFELSEENDLIKQELCLMGRMSFC